MTQDDPRAFRPHLSGADLDRAREKVLAAILRSPGLWASAARSNIGRYHFGALAPIFDLATRKPERIRDLVMSGNDPQVRRLYGLPVYLHHGVILSLARQIVESRDRSEAAEVIKRGKKDSASFPRGSEAFASFETSAEVVDTSVVAPSQKPVAVPEISDEQAGTSKRCNGPTSEVLPTEPVPQASQTTVSVDNVVAVPAMRVDQTAAKLKPVGIGKAAVMAFLREILAQGPVAARKIEGLAMDAGLLPAGAAIGDAKSFRSARRALGVKTYQRPGQKSGGWIWSLPIAA